METTTKTLLVQLRETHGLVPKELASTSTSTSTIINNQTIATNISNLHIIKNKVELDSSLQGHLKALSKLTRGIERDNHYTELLQASINSSRPPRGLISKVTPRIPDTPATFTIEWEDSLQRAGLILTEKLRDYWKDRSSRLEQEYSSILQNLKSLTNQDQWNTVEDILAQIARETQQELKRKKSKQPTPTSASNNQAKRNIRIAGTRSPTPPITNLINHNQGSQFVWKTWKNRKSFPVREISGNLKILQNIREKSGKNFSRIIFYFFILYRALPIQMHFWETFWIFFI